MNDQPNTEPIYALIEPLKQYLHLSWAVSEPVIDASLPSSGRRKPTSSKVIARVANIAPSNPDGCEVVFVGVGLRVSRTGETSFDQRIRPIANHIDKVSSEVRRQPEGIVWTFGSDPHADLSNGQPAIVLFPGETVEFEMEIPTAIMGQMAVQVEGQVSRRHLFHMIHRVPRGWTKAAVMPLLQAIKNIDFKPSTLNIDVIPDFGRFTTVNELNSFGTTVEEAAREISSYSEKLRMLCNDTPFRDMEATLRPFYGPFVRDLRESCLECRDAISASNGERIRSAVNLLKERLAAADEVKKHFDEMISEYESKLNASDA